MNLTTVLGVKTSAVARVRENFSASDFAARGIMSGQICAGNLFAVDSAVANQHVDDLGKRVFVPANQIHAHHSNKKFPAANLQQGRIFFKLTNFHQ